MKVGLQCAHCLLERAINQAKLASSDPSTHMKVVTEILKMLGEKYGSDAVPSHIGTDRDLLVQRITGKDPYEDLKRISNTMALSILPELLRLVDSASNSYSRFRKATLIAAAANSIEFDVTGRRFDLGELRIILSNVERDLAVDDISKFYDLCNEVSEVVYLMDNAGEIVLDMILIKEIKRLGPKVIAVVKGGPVLNDATLSDARDIKLNEYADAVIDTGAPAIGVNPERNSKEFLELLEQAELIVAKGMGNYESMTELSLPAPVVHILRSKCEPVAAHIGCERNKNVVMVR